MAGAVADACGCAAKPHRRGYRLLWWSLALLAAGVPLSLLGKIGYQETWEAFNRYTSQVLSLATTHTIHVPSPEDAVHNYTLLDADLIHWQQGISQVYGRISRMAVVGIVTDADTGLEFEFSHLTGQISGSKGRFYAKRDLSMLVYLALSAATYFSDSVHLALVVVNLNLYSIALCLRLKGMGDAIGKAVETLKDAQEAFMLLPIETSLLELVQQQACLQKLMAIIADWSGVQLGMSITLPIFHTVTISTSVMSSLAAATTVRALHVIVYGCIPGLPRIQWRRMLGQAAEVHTRVKTEMARMRQYTLQRDTSFKDE